MKYPGYLIRRGATGPAVLAIQRVLRIQETAAFGPTTEKVVRAFQQEQGLPVDGIVGPATWAELFKPRPVRLAALALARKQIGVSEQPRGSNRGPEIDRWNQLAGVPLGSFWCMSFVYGMFHAAAGAAGLALPLPRTASCSTLFAWAKRNGKLVLKPEPGDVFLVRGGAAGRTHQHTGFVAGPVVNGRFPSIEGNSNSGGSRNGVEVASRPARSTRGLDFVRLG